MATPCPASSVFSNLLRRRTRRKEVSRKVVRGMPHATNAGPAWAALKSVQQKPVRNLESARTCENSLKETCSLVYRRESR